MPDVSPCAAAAFAVTCSIPSAGYPSLAASPRDRRDEEEQRRRGRDAEKPGGDAVSGRNSGRQEGDGCAGEGEQRSHEQAPCQDGDDSRSLDLRVRRDERSDVHVCERSDPSEPQDRTDGAMTDDCRAGRVPEWIVAV